MSIFTRAMGGVFIIGFSFVGIVYEHSLLPQTFSWNEFYNLNSVMSVVVLMSVFRETSNKILSIDPKKRKELKINKSTLWYQQKKIKEGKQLKLYQKTIAKLEK